MAIPSYRTNCYICPITRMAMKPKSIILLTCAAIAAVATFFIARNSRNCGEAVVRTEAPAEEEAPRYDTIPLNRRIARMFVVGIDSTALKENDPIIKKVRELGVGGVILFGYNIPKGDENATSKEKLTRLCSDLQELADYRLMIGTDQEGGKVMRLRRRDGYIEMPSHKHLGKMDSEDSTRFHAGRTAAMMDEIGINMNFAPCADMNVNPSCPVIGRADRAFSSNPEKVRKHASYFIDEHRRRGIATAVKHFPGHGSSVSDSHMGLPDVSGTWSGEELIPFRNLVKEGSCDMIMVGHIFNSRIDPDYPASLSKAAVDSLLRKEIGWDGVVISDDIGMKAINSNFPLEKSLELCINAGVDMMMLIANGAHEKLEHAIDTIAAMVTEGIIPEERITESYARIDRLFGQE